MKTTFICQAANTIQQAILANETDIESLDRAIGDGDHYINIKRASELVAGMSAELAPLKPDEALLKIGNKLLSNMAALLAFCLPAFLCAWPNFCSLITIKQTS